MYPIELDSNAVHIFVSPTLHVRLYILIITTIEIINIWKTNNIKLEVVTAHSFVTIDFEFVLLESIG